MIIKGRGKGDPKTKSHRESEQGQMGGRIIRKASRRGTFGWTPKDTASLPALSYGGKRP